MSSIERLVNRHISSLALIMWPYARLATRATLPVASPRRTGPRVSISGTWKGRGSATSVLGSRIVCRGQIDNAPARRHSDVSLSDDASVTGSVTLLCSSLPYKCLGVRRHYCVARSFVGLQLGERMERRKTARVWRVSLYGATSYCWRSLGSSCLEIMENAIPGSV